MAKTLGDTDRVSAGVVEDGCHAMAELMSVDMGQLMAPLKFSPVKTELSNLGFWVFRAEKFASGNFLSVLLTQQ